MSGLNLVFVNFRKPYYLHKYFGPSSNLPLANCMSFSCKFKTLRKGNSYDFRTQPKMSTQGDENTGEAEIIEGNEENNIRFSPVLVAERIKASLEPLRAQISALTEMMDRIIQSNLTTESTTASSRGPGLQHESPYNEGPASFKLLTVAPPTTAGYSHDSILERFGNRGFQKVLQCQKRGLSMRRLLKDFGIATPLSRETSGPEFCAIWLRKVPDSG